ncbi:hypothetical protein CBOM_02999 [Ceraceosorus bombacis]|uniref:Uncharacterized protein n=1 Tax=Ceraceosorus bombacis TaxID=401625 RepID=A0A0P1BMQ7_9BASI|nr:hypothetical protein CBOM_02999 [Ceraceosorus bombacis]
MLLDNTSSKRASGNLSPRKLQLLHHTTHTIRHLSSPARPARAHLRNPSSIHASSFHHHQQAFAFAPASAAAGAPTAASTAAAAASRRRSLRKITGVQSRRAYFNESISNPNANSTKSNGHLDEQQDATCTRASAPRVLPSAAAAATSGEGDGDGESDGDGGLRLDSQAQSLLLPALADAHAHKPLRPLILLAQPTAVNDYALLPSTKKATAFEAHPIWSDLTAAATSTRSVEKATQLLDSTGHSTTRLETAQLVKGSPALPSLPTFTVPTLSDFRLGPNSRKAIDRAGLSSGKAGLISSTRRAVSTSHTPISPSSFSSSSTSAANKFTLHAPPNQPRRASAPQISVPIAPQGCSFIVPEDFFSARPKEEERDIWIERRSDKDILPPARQIDCAEPVGKDRRGEVDQEAEAPKRSGAALRTSIDRTAGAERKKTTIRGRYRGRLC